MQRLQFSGYPREFRQQVLTSALKKYDRKMTASLREGGADNIQQHQQQSVGDKVQWYARDGQFESVMFVEATPGSELAKRVRSVVERLRLRIKIVEKAGTTIKGLLQKSDPFGVNHCGRERCLICESGCPVDCRVRGCVYQYICEECKRKYRGQTGRAIFERNNEHMEAWEQGEDECPLQRHSNLYHGGRRFNVDLEVIAKCYGKPSRRMITEAVLIGEIPDNETMNNKSEWNYANLDKMNLNG